MSKYVIDSATLTDIADAIRAKTKDTATMTPADMPDEIESIEGNKTLLDLLMTFKTDRGQTVDFGKYTKLRTNLLLSEVNDNGAVEYRGDNITEIASSALCDSKSSTVGGTESKSMQRAYFPACKTIGSYAFAGDCYLQDLQIPSVESISGNAFQHCTDLPSVVLPSTLTYLGARAFYGCSRLASVRFCGTPTSAIPSDVFYNCTALTDIYVPWAEGEVSGAPWGANSATIHYNTPAT